MGGRPKAAPPLLAHVGAASGGRGGMWGADGGGSPLRKSQEGQPPRIMLPSCAGGRVLPALPRLLDQSPQVLRILFEIRPGFGLGPVRVSANIFELESGPGAEILWAHWRLGPVRARPRLGLDLKIKI